eukprot:gb/GFBE01014166.1/.p1 GENE.gb/GFBE01014166.1/~~gb/GFBE01014166.1/.p1  ORF type:complete len:200 (+),score=35.85 gb/GFBE01014166.1/:1-600(+)
MASRGLDRDALQRDLVETMRDRKAFEQKLRELRAEVRLIEASVDALVQKENWLQRELVNTPAVAEPLTSLDDFLSGRAPAPQLASAGPAFFELSAAGAETPRQAADDAEGAELGDDWEAVLDATGVARCGQCGVRLPLDMAAIEKHSKQCCSSPKRVSAPGADGLSGRCSDCGMFLPLTMDGVERHACTGRVDRPDGDG